MLKPGSIDPVIHEPVRLALMVALDGRVADFAYLKNCLDLTDGNLMFHLRKLIEAGYLHSTQHRVAARRLTFYGLTHEGAVNLANYRRLMREILDGPRE